MNNKKTGHAVNPQQARADYLHERLEAERWTYRKLEGRTGMSRSKIASRLAGDTELTFNDVVMFADVLERDPAELFKTLMELPEVDSNHQPAG